MSHILSCVLHLARARDLMRVSFPDTLTASFSKKPSVIRFVLERSTAKEFFPFAMKASDREEDLAVRHDEQVSATTGKTEGEEASFDARGSLTSSAGSEDDGWFGGIGADFRSIACTLKGTAEGVASFVHRSAVAVAAEIAELENSENSQNPEQTGDKLKLPWVVNGENETESEDSELKDKILELSKNEATFLGPHEAEENLQDSFVLDDARVDLIRQLLDVDEALAGTHARLSGRNNVHETFFWRNYFHHVEEARKCHLAESEDIVSLPSENSLVPVQDGEQQFEPDSEESESAFVRVPSPPPSAGVMSVGSLVVVEKIGN